MDERASVPALMSSPPVHPHTCTHTNTHIHTQSHTITHTISHTTPRCHTPPPLPSNSVGGLDAKEKAALPSREAVAALARRVEREGTHHQLIRVGLQICRERGGETERDGLVGGGVGMHCVHSGKDGCWHALCPNKREAF